MDGRFVRQVNVTSCGVSELASEISHSSAANLHTTGSEIYMEFACFAAPRVRPCNKSPAYTHLVNDVKFLVGDFRLEESGSVDVSFSRDVVSLFKIKASNLEVNLHLKISAVYPVSKERVAFQSERTRGLCTLTLEGGHYRFVHCTMIHVN